MKTSLLGAFVVSLIQLSAYASVSTHARVETQPEAFRPNVVLNDVQGAGNNRVTEVTLEFPELSLAVPMKPQGDRSWKAEFTDEQLQLLKQDGQSKRSATLVIKSSNDKHRVEKTKKQIEVTIGG